MKKENALKNKVSTKEKQPTLLIILDGFGLASEKNKGNAITRENAPHIFQYIDEYPTAKIKTWGKHVGLFEDQEGNSEAGHMNIGAGRIVKQDLVEISEAIHNGTFFKKEAFKQAIYHVRKYKTAVHIMGLLTDKNSAHAYPEHLYAMLELFRREEVSEVYLHLFTDGRDSPPHAASTYLHELQSHMLSHEKIATVMGRFYAMDRNKIWERTKKVYEAMVLGKGCLAMSAEEAINQSYNRKETDEFICPTVIVKDNRPVATIKDNDSIFFINARSDRARQITKSFVQRDFNKKNPRSFRRKRYPKNTRFVAMTDFGPDLSDILTAFPSPDLSATLPMALHDVSQFYIAESEKYAHVTYFINGGYKDAVNGEERMLIPSTGVQNYETNPEMSAGAITREVLKRLKRNSFEFYCINFANPDMVGHTGNFVAGKKAVKYTDKYVHTIVEDVLKRNGNVLIVSDHGNAEEMIRVETGEVMTQHTKNFVPFIVIGNKWKGKRIRGGILADVAPTILKIMNIKQPKEMTGKSLI